MKKTFAVLVAGVFAVVASVSVSFASGLMNFKSYSADMVMTGSHGSTTSKVFATPTKQRMEMKADRSETIMITRFDKKMAWMCMKDQKMCMEMALGNQTDIQSQLMDPDAKVQKDFLANENVDGHPSKKYHITVTRNGKKESSGFIWEASDLNNFPVKYQTEDKSSTIVWKNISFSSIPDSMFELPQGYQKMDMKNMPGMGGMGGGKRRGRN